MRHLRHRVEPAEVGSRLDACVGRWMAEALEAAPSKSAVRRLIMAGAVRVDGQPQRRPGLELRGGQLVEARVDEARLRPAGDVAFVLDRSRVVHEDAWLLVVDKPPGLPTVATADPSRPYLVAAVEAYLRAQGNAAPYVGVHQRLDRETSGLVLFAKDAAVNPALAAAFAAREVEKTYEALSARGAARVPQSWDCRDPIGGKAAETHFECREARAHGLHVVAHPRTGRKHQIRIHLAAGGRPILGDERYGRDGRETASAPRLMLHASALRLAHPHTGRALELTSALPGDFDRVRAALGPPVRSGGAAPR